MKVKTILCFCKSVKDLCVRPINPSPAEPGYALPQANSVDPDQLASEEANWPGSALFAIKYVNLYQQSGSSNLIGWKLEMGMSS